MPQLAPQPQTLIAPTAQEPPAPPTTLKTKSLTVAGHGKSITITKATEVPVSTVPTMLGNMISVVGVGVMGCWGLGGCMGRVGKGGGVHSRGVLRWGTLQTSATVVRSVKEWRKKTSVQRPGASSRP
jgi:hypothetical protein